MRRLLILAVLLGGMQLILPLGAPGQGSQPLLAFGFLILAAYTVGEMAPALRLPKIVGYLAAGVLFGPAVLGTISYSAAGRLEPVSELAVALIAFLAGAELRWGEVKERGPTFLKIMGSELAVSFVAIFGILYAAQEVAPFLHGATSAQVLAFALVFASIAIVHSPAVTMALISETGAHGPVARTTLGVVLLADVAVVLLFSASSAAARAIAPAVGGAGGASVLSLIWEIGGAVVVGALLGGIIALYLRFVHRELMLFAILVAYFGLEIAHFAHVELLLTLLTAGFVAENVSRPENGEALRHAMERSAAPLFVVFFALSGAKIHVEAVAELFPLVLPLALVRGGGIWMGTRLGGRWAGMAGPERKVIWMGLISQAGVAIGLSAIAAEAFPDFGVQLQTLLLALIAINESVGAIFFRRALDKNGEIRGEGPERAPRPSRAAAAAH